MDIYVHAHACVCISACIYMQTLPSAMSENTSPLHYPILTNFLNEVQI